MSKCSRISLYIRLLFLFLFFYSNLSHFVHSFSRYTRINSKSSLSFFNPFSLSLQIFCSPTEPAGCPGGSVCLPTPLLPSLFICCRSTVSPRVCPNNQNTLVTSTGALESCTGPGSPCSRVSISVSSQSMSLLQTGYTCQLSSVLAQWVCCGVDGTAAKCADGSETYTQVTGISLLSLPLSFLPFRRDLHLFPSLLPILLSIWIHMCSIISQWNECLLSIQCKWGMSNWMESIYE